MSLSLPLSSPFTEATASSSTLVPFPYDVAINGRPYMIDEKFVPEYFRRTSIELTAGQQDSSDEPGESSLSREDLWRRTAEDWSHGAGQVYYDKKESDRARFRSSIGVDVWTRWELGLLPDTEQIRASVATNLQVLSVGNRFYVVDGQQVYFDTTLTAPTFTSSVIQNGESATTVSSIASDGFNVWAALGANGIHTTTRTTSTSSHYSDLQATLVGYLKGRLMAAVGPSLYNVTAAGAAPTALFTQGNSDFTWVGFAEGSSALYAAGYSGDKSLIYRCAVKTDGTALDAPIVAAELPDGEVVRSIQGYLGRFLLIGSDKGVRFAQSLEDTEGDLTVGALIPTPGPVRCFEPQDRFVWFGYEVYDSSHSGLGRLDLSVLNESVPAYASDLMVTSQNPVLSVATFDEKRIFTISGLGVYKESDNKVSEGTLDTGFISYDMYDLKTAATIGLGHNTAFGSYSVDMFTDTTGVFTQVGNHVAGATAAEQFTLSQTVAERFEFRLHLDRDATDATKGPTVRRWTLRAKPGPRRNTVLSIPLKLFDHMQDREGGDLPLTDPQLERQVFEALCKTPATVTVQIGDEALPMYIKDYLWIGDHRTEDRKDWNGTAVLSMSTID